MKITLFGAIWLIISIYLFFQKSAKGIIAFAVFSMIFQCNNVFSIGETSIGVQIVVVAIALLRLLLVRITQGLFYKEKIFQKVNYSFEFKKSILWILLFSILLSLIVNKRFASTYIISFFMILIYVLFAVFLYDYEFEISEKWIDTFEDRLTITIVLIGFLQYMTKLGILPLERILQIFIYNDVSNTNVIFNYKQYIKQFYSTFMEPSYCGAFLVGLFVLYILRDKATKKNLVFIFLITLCILLTESSTAYLGLVFVLIILLLKKGPKKFFLFCLPIGLFFAILFVILRFDIVNKVIFSKKDTGSFRVRMALDGIALLNFVKHPIFGVGYRCSRASSLFCSILGELGIFGFFAYFSLLFYYLRFTIKGENTPFITKHSLFLVGIIICQLIACPDLNFSPFWLSVYLQILSCKTEKKKYDIINSKINY